MARPAKSCWSFGATIETGEVSLDPLRWGLIPHFCEDPKGGRKPINAKCETVGTLPTFRDAYRRRRCIVPIDGFFEWKAIKGKAKQPYAIAMKDGYPFGLGGIWENWKDPASGEWVRTFAIITTNANELVAEIHNRMPLILALADYARRLSDEPDPRDLLRQTRLRRCGSGRSQRVSTSRRTTTRQSFSRSSYLPLSYVISVLRLYAFNSNNIVLCVLLADFARRRLITS